MEEHFGVVYLSGVVRLEFRVSCLLGKCTTFPVPLCTFFTAFSVFLFLLHALLQVCFRLWKHEPSLASVSLCSQGWSWISDPPASTSQVLGLQAWTTLTALSSARFKWRWWWSPGLCACYKLCVNWTTSMASALCTQEFHWPFPTTCPVLGVIYYSFLMKNEGIYLNSHNLWLLRLLTSNHMSPSPRCFLYHIASSFHKVIKLVTLTIPARWAKTKIQSLRPAWEWDISKILKGWQAW